MSNFVSDAVKAKKMLEIERQALEVAEELQRVLNKRQVSPAVACLAITEVYLKTKTFYPDVMKAVHDKFTIEKGGHGNDGQRDP